MKILHVTAGIQETCGVSCFVMETAKAQRAAGHQVCIVTSMTCGYPVGDMDVRLMPDPTAVDFEPDIVHIHCTWNTYVHKMAVWSREREIPYMISPHGALTPWALKYHWWKKLPALLLYQYRDFRKAAGFHVTADAERKDIRHLGLKQQVVIAPLGCHISDTAGAERGKDLLFLSRIHPKKGLLMLLHAWRDVPQNERGGGRLIIAGPDDIGHQAELKAEAEKLGLSVCDFSHDLQYGKKQIHGGGEVPAEVYREKLAGCRADVIFPGPVYSGAKDFLYQSAKYFILPSFSENFGAVVLEALAAGTPVITTTGTPWKELPENGCGWQVSPSFEEVKEAIRRAYALPQTEYETMSRNARRFVQTEYSWNTTAQTLIQAYQQILKQV